MRILCLGDIHDRATTPRARKDNYVLAFRGKMEQVSEIADHYKVSHIIAPGDVFDTATPPLWVIRWAVRRHRTMQLLAILGQHDQRYHHNAIDNTPLGILEAARAVRVLGALPYVDRGIEFYGSSWSEPIPKVKPGNFMKVLVMHRMVIGSEKLWKQQQGFMWSRHVLRRYPEFDLIVTGDNHHSFFDEVGGRHLVNCGSFMRSNVDQVKHKPVVVIYDTKTKEIHIEYLDVAPASEVLDVEASEQAKERNADLEAFIEQVVKGKGSPDLDFLANLDKKARAKGVPKGVTIKINEIVRLSDGQ